jgi:hypothetical protein
MAKSKKKTTAQQIMGIAAIAMPAPIRDIVVSRWGARLSLVLAAAMIASGILTLQWTDGKPHVQVNRERAVEVQHNLEHRVEHRLGQAEEKPDAKEWLNDHWNHLKKQH